jgi:hypothetical protein
MLLSLLILLVVGRFIYEYVPLVAFTTVYKPKLVKDSEGIGVKSPRMRRKPFP